MTDKTAQRALKIAVEKLRDAADVTNQQLADALGGKSEAWVRSLLSVESDARVNETHLRAWVPLLGRANLWNAYHEANGDVLDVVVRVSKPLPMDPVRRVAEAMKETGEAAMVAGAAMADGRILPGELAEIEKECAEGVRSLHALGATARAAAVAA